MRINMYNYDEDFYDEPSMFEQQIDEFKQSLLKCVKSDYITEMEKLRLENAELQEVKKNYTQIQQDYKNKEYQLQNERNDLTRKVRSERLSILMKDFEVVMYAADTKRVSIPKCNKCDESRKVYFKTPSGKDTHEMCECNKSITKYFPEEIICCEFRIDREKNSMILWYKINPEREYDYGKFSSSTVSKNKYVDGMKYEEIDSWGTFFSSKKDCQKYCNWLNKKESVVIDGQEFYPYEEEDSED